MALNAFITGATGFVGSNLARELLAAGWNVTALARAGASRKDLEGFNVRWREGDLTQAESLIEAMPADIDCVFHVAADTNVWAPNNERQTRVNVEGTRNIIQAAMRRGAARFIHTSSFIVWGFQGTPLRETSQRQENADWINYVRTKHTAEELVRAAVRERDFKAVIVTPAHILGPGDRHNWSRMILLVDQKKLPGIPPGGGAFADVREIAKAQINAFHSGRKGENYLLGGEDHSFLEVVSIAGELLGRKVPKRTSPAWLLRLAGQAHQIKSRLTRREPDITPESVAMITRHIECDSSKAQRELGYRFTPVRHLLKDTVDWLRKEGLLRDREAGK